MPGRVSLVIRTDIPQAAFLQPVVGHGSERDRATLEDKPIALSMAALDRVAQSRAEPYRESHVCLASRALEPVTAKVEILADHEAWRLAVVGYLTREPAGILDLVLNRTGKFKGLAVQPLGRLVTEDTPARDSRKRHACSVSTIQRFYP